MNDEQKTQYIRRMQEGMRPMTTEQIAERQAKDYASMANALKSNGDAARNFWPEMVGKTVGASNPPPSEKTTVFQKLMRLFYVCKPRQR